MEASDWPTSAAAYRLLYLIGEGEFGSVHSAQILEGSHAGFLVAVKILDLEHSSSSNIESVRTEISMMRLNSHENLVSYYVCFLNDTQLWLVMPLSEGGSLANVLKQLYLTGIKDEAILASFLAQALQGLNYLHTRKKIHRDIKASNILIGADGRVMLSDFGVAADLKNRKACRTFVGSPCWIAPEVVESNSGYDFKADIWSFGITALELAYGQPPYLAYPPMKVILKVLHSDPPRIKATDPFSSYFREMVHSCLQKDPRRRPTACELLNFSFFLKARTPEFLITHILSKLQPLAQLTGRSPHSRRLQVETPITGSWDFNTSSDFSETSEQHDVSMRSSNFESDPLESLAEDEDEFCDISLG
jgi:serine/threonine-protein kinase OSR1/STK39